MSVKNKETDKIKFVKVNTSGSVTSAFPHEMGEADLPPLSDSENAGTTSPLQEDLSYSREFRVESHEPEIEEQLDAIRNQVNAVVNQTQSPSLNSNELEVLKKYLSLKEAEARDLRDQHAQYQNYLKKLSIEIDRYSQKNRDLVSELDAVRRREDSLKKELADQGRQQEHALSQLRQDYDDRLRKAGGYEHQVEDLMQKREEWRNKVKEDLKRIKLKEREMENRYDLLKRDMQALLDSKDKHALEQKKKSDALELEMETLEERLRSASARLNAVTAKKKRLVETMKLALNLLDSIDLEDLTLTEKDTTPQKKTG